MNTPYQSFAPSRLVAVLGPTNTGKTHLAVERMLAHQSGMMGFPLRLLAREVYDRVVSIKGPERVALITGEERILPPYADYFLCTAESMPLQREVAFLAVDEIQMCADSERGHIFTDRLLHARGTQETMFLGADSMRPLMRKLFPDIEIVERLRFSNLSYIAPKKLSRLPRRSAIVAFSVADVYAIAELLRRQKGGAAIVMGALSPRTRNAQVEMYQSGEVDYLVATDAIGMGLNMDIDLVALSATRKFDGHKFRDLTAAELAQIAGRAGRHMSDGQFTTLSGTENGAALDPQTIERIEEHRFDPIRRLSWRTHKPDYSSVETLVESLEQRPDSEIFSRARQADDLATLKYLAPRPQIRERATNATQTRLLWETCQIPDFRKLALDTHARLVETIFTHLSDADGVLPDKWFETQVSRLDNTTGDIDTLAARIAAVRVWTYVAHRENWLRRSEHWVDATRSIEDRLSDALHERLTQRFVDRRTAVLLREMRAKGELMVTIDTQDGNDEISVEGHIIGRLEGFVFHTDPSANGDEGRMLRQAGEKTLRLEIEKRALALSAAEDGEFTMVYSRGFHQPLLKWRGQTVAEVTAGDDIYVPRVQLLPNTLLDGPLAQQVQERLNNWLKSHIATLLEPLVKLRDILRAQAKGTAEVALDGQARAVAYRIVEALGILPRSEVIQEVRALDQNIRRGLRQYGIRFSANYIFMSAMLKPAPTDLRLALWAMSNGQTALPQRPTPGLVHIETEKRVPYIFYQMAGFRTVGHHAVRIDMMERLADSVRPLGQDGQAFTVSPDLMGLVGASGDDFAAIMRALGYAQIEVDKSQLPAQEAPQEEKSEVTTTEAETPAEDAKTEAAPEAEGEAKVEQAETAEATTPEDEKVQAFVWDKQRNQRRPAPKGRRPQAKDAKGDKPRRPAKGKPRPKQGPKVISSGEVKGESPFAALADLKKTMAQK